MAEHSDVEVNNAHAGPQPQIPIVTENRNLKTHPFSPGEDRFTTGKQWKEWLEGIEREFRYFKITDAIEKKDALIIYGGKEIARLEKSLPNPTTEGSVVVIDDGVAFEDLANYLVNLPGRVDMDDGFYAMNLDNIVEKYQKWVGLLPRIRPFYAVKANPDPIIVRLFAKMGTGFDCASKGEITLALDSDSAPQDIIYAHTCKKLSHIKFAKECGVSMMTFDCEAELHKIKEVYPEAEILLRFSPTLRNSVYDANGHKFGAALDSCSTLLANAKNLGLNVVGISFHIGCGCHDATPYQDAIRNARHLFDIGEKLGFSFKILDIGGGFPGKPGQLCFEKICDVVNTALDKYFPAGSGVKIIAEPGRYFPITSCTLVANVTTVKEIKKHHLKEKKEMDCPPVTFNEEDETGYMYYIDEGIFGSFLRVHFDPGLDAFEHPKTLKKHDDNTTYPSIIWGQSCCTHDYVNKNCMLPKLSPGDWVYFEDMGAYTRTVSTRFHGVPPHYTYYYATRKTWERVKNYLEDFNLEVFDFSLEN